MVASRRIYLEKLDNDIRQGGGFGKKVATLVDLF